MIKAEAQTNKSSPLTALKKCYKSTLYQYTEVMNVSNLKRQKPFISGTVEAKDNAYVDSYLNTDTKFNQCWLYTVGYR